MCSAHTMNKFCVSNFEKTKKRIMFVKRANVQRLGYLIFLCLFTWLFLMVFVFNRKATKTDFRGEHVLGNVNGKQRQLTHLLQDKFHLNVSKNVQTVEMFSFYDKKVSKASRTTVIYDTKTLQSYILQKHQTGLQQLFKNETCRKRLPKCIIIGMSKCGTTELQDFLALHPYIEITYRRTPYYEVNYFNQDKIKDLDWYRNMMPCSFSTQVTVEKTPTYFIHPLAAERIHKMDPNIKLILMVREPVQRSISHFTFTKRTKPNISLERCAITRTGLPREDCGFVRGSMYSWYMKTWLKYFNLSQIMIIDNKDLISNPVSVLRKVEMFLDIGHQIDSDDFIYNGKKGFWCIKEQVNKLSKNQICYGNARGRKTNESFDSNTLEKLHKFFRVHNEEFFNMTGRVFEW